MTRLTSTGPQLGAIADDMTGATDLANTLVKSGLRTVQLIGVPEAGFAVPDAEAIVVALKSRTTPVADAVASSRASLAWLLKSGVRQIFFKYCSTFDSTDKGNIGPVAEALLTDLKSDFTIACPAFPENGRTIYLGHLFVGDRLLSDSSMRHHPLTPMTESDLVRVLGKQTTGKVGLIPLATVSGGPIEIANAIDRLRREGYRHAIVDAVTNQNLMDIGEAAVDLLLVTGGSGLALGLPANFARRYGFTLNTQAAGLPNIDGAAAVVSGSCSAATLRQVQNMQQSCPSFTVDPLKLAKGDDVVGEALAWAKPRLGPVPILISASASHEVVAKVQTELGRNPAGALVETALGAIAKGLVAAGVRRLVVAGGETSGEVVRSLGISALRIGPQIDPGVPWTISLSKPQLALALKSGNFGSDNFFTKAFGVLEGAGS